MYNMLYIHLTLCLITKFEVIGAFISHICEVLAQVYHIKYRNETEPEGR